MSVTRGRLTRAQRRALDELYPQYQIDLETKLDLLANFGRSAPLGVEIGFGMGQALAQWATEKPDWNLIGAEIYPPGVGSLLNQVEAGELTNVRVAMDKAEVLLDSVLETGSVDEVRVLFPDPWPKKRHIKRRLLQHGTVEQIARCLKPGGRLLVATDWQPYAEWALQQLGACTLLRNTVDGYATRAPRGELTKFEQRGLRLGHEIYDLVFTRAA